MSAAALLWLNNCFYRTSALHDGGWLLPDKEFETFGCSAVDHLCWFWDKAPSVQGAGDDEGKQRTLQLLITPALDWLESCVTGWKQTHRGRGSKWSSVGLCCFDFGDMCGLKWSLPWRSFTILPSNRLSNRDFVSCEDEICLMLMGKCVAVF